MRRIDIPKEKYWVEVASIRAHLHAIDNEDVARMYIDAIMTIDVYCDILLDCFCTGMTPGKWWGVYYGDWC
jgi:hypothetical protein